MLFRRFLPDQRGLESRLALPVDGQRTGIFSAQPVDTRVQQSITGRGGIGRSPPSLNKHEIFKKRKEKLFVGMKLAEFAAYILSRYRSLSPNVQLCTAHTYSVCIMGCCTQLATRVAKYILFTTDSSSRALKQPTALITYYLLYI